MVDGLQNARGLGAPFRAGPRRKAREIYILAKKSDLPLPSESQILDFLSLLRKIVRHMGGNPETVKVMITDSVTEAREIDDQLYFNYSLAEASPFFWILIAAREIAGLKYRNKNYPFVKAMSALVERAMEHLDEIYSEFIERTNKQHLQ